MYLCQKVLFSMASVSNLVPLIRILLACYEVGKILDWYIHPTYSVWDCEKFLRLSFCTEHWHPPPPPPPVFLFLELCHHKFMWCRLFKNNRHLNWNWVSIKRIPATLHGDTNTKVFLSKALLQKMSSAYVGHFVQKETCKPYIWGSQNVTVPWLLWRF